MLSDFHCHTHFSVDGHPSPEAVLEAAAERGISHLSITEHNSIASLPRAMKRAGELGIQCFPGVEIDLFWQGRQLHALAYGFNPENRELQQLLRRHLAVYSSFYPYLLAEMEARGLPVDREALAAAKAKRYPTYPQQVDNLWFWRHYYSAIYPEELLAEIIAAARQNAAAEHACFSHFEQGLELVHRAGGVVLLAHVGRYFSGDVDSQIALIDELLEVGMDGFELYHPKNCDQTDFSRLERFANKRGCLISGGSDTHTLSGAVPLGGMSAPLPLLTPLLERLCGS